MDGNKTHGNKSLTRLGARRTVLINPRRGGTDAREGTRVNVTVGRPLVVGNSITGVPVRDAAVPGNGLDPGYYWGAEFNSSLVP